MKNIKAKKKFGQHFLKDKAIAKEIVDSLQAVGIDHVIEIGPGMGVLTEFILQKPYSSSFIEIDEDAADFLRNNFPEIDNRLINYNFLKLDIDASFQGKLALIGNFPYNISSQILFKMLDHKSTVLELVGMFQKEVAERVIAEPGKKVYGIISVFVQAYYHTEKIMDIGPEMFNPSPKVHSSVIRLRRNSVTKLDCDENLFFKIVKQTFNQRRKMIRNTIKSFGIEDGFESEYFTKRPEQLSVIDFVKLTNEIEKSLIDI